MVTTIFFIVKKWKTLETQNRRMLGSRGIARISTVFQRARIPEGGKSPESTNSSRRKIASEHDFKEVENRQRARIPAGGKSPESTAFRRE